MKRYYIYLLLILLVATSCKKEKICAVIGNPPLTVQFCESDTKFDRTPYITSVTIIKGSEVPLKELNDSLILRIDFTDGDGDLGFRKDFVDSICAEPCFPNGCLTENPFSVRLQDTRLLDDTLLCNRIFVLYDSITRVFSIEGEMYVLSEGICCIDTASNLACIRGASPQAFDTTTYLVQIKDRAGNLSNIVETPPIIIDCSY